jgi:DnaJ-class molecular chaperone
MADDDDDTGYPTGRSVCGTCGGTGKTPASGVDGASECPSCHGTGMWPQPTTAGMPTGGSTIPPRM